MQHRSLLAVVAFCVLTFIAVNPASALSLSSADGDWSNAVGVEGGEPICLFYLEDRVTFGTPNVLGICPFFSDLNVQSGIEFTGTSSITAEPGVIFILGELTHYNNQLFRANNLDTVDLAIDLDFVDPVISTTLNYTVDLDETPNFPSGGECPYGDTPPCADALQVLQGVDEQLFDVDGVQYTLDIVGFTPGTLGQCQYNPANVIESFISEEESSNSACLFARFLVAEPALAVEKTADVTTAGVGETVNYTITVSNIGGIALTNVVVSDPLLGINQNVGTIQPGNETSVYGSYTVSANDLPGSLINTATADSDQTDPIQDSYTVTLEAPATGNVQVDKVVDWSGVEPNQTVIFEICLAGPSFAQPNCQITDFDGGSLFWNDLQPGTYTVTEVEPGVNWSVEGSGMTVNVVAGTTQMATIINTYVPYGSISAIKSVNWNGAEINQAQSFEICAVGPSYPTPACQSVGAEGGTLVWQNVVPGTYTITETNPGADWTVSGSGVQVGVNPGENSAVAITNTYTPPVAVCEDPDPARDLSGMLLGETGFTTGRIVNTSEVCSYTIGIASYLKYDDIIDNQVLFNSNSGMIQPGQTIEISVTLPACATQVDLFYGDVLQNLNGVRYGPRLLDAVHLGGTNFCVDE